jgi:hypothetical protein
MPPAVLIVAGAASTFVGVSLGIGFLAKLGVGLILTGISSKIAENKAGDPSPITTTGRTQMIRQPITAHRIIYGQVRVSGPITFVFTSSSPSGKANNQLQLIVTLAAHECQEVGEVWLDEEILPAFVDPTPSGRWANNAKFYRSRGTVADDVALGNGVRTQAPDNTLWTTDHKQTSCAKIAISFFYDADMFPGSLPQVSCIVKGRKVYDPRTAQDYDDPSTWVYSNNAALALLDYIAGYQLNSDGTTRVPIGLGENLSGIDTASFIAAANVCDEAVALDGGGTEPRYTCNGIITTSESPKDVIRKLLTALDGKLIRTGGKWRLLAASYQAPTLTLTEDDLEGPVKVVTRLGRRELFNSIKGVFVSPDSKWQPIDLPPLQSATFIAQDQDEVLWSDINLPFTTSSSMAQRLMKIALLKARQQISVALTCKLTTFRVLSGDNIMLTLPRFGWTSKVFEVKNWKFSIRNDDMPRLGVDLVLRETAAAVYDWNSSEEDPIDPAPDTGFPDATTVEPPGAPVITEVLYVTLDGVTVKAKAVLDWAASPDAFLDDYQVEWKLSTSGTWMVAGRTDTNTFEILDVAPGTYDFRVKAINVLGVSSEYATTPFVDFLGVSAPPGSPTGLTLQKMGGIAILRWDVATDIDVLVGGQVLFRHDQDQATPTWETSVSIGDFTAGSANVAILPLKPGTYLMKFQDQSGVVSTTAATVSTDGATILEYGNFSSIAEEPDFDGVHVNTVSPDTVLKLAAAGLWDDIPDVDALDDIDSFGGILSSGTYDFFFSIDTGAVTRVRLRTVLTVAIENVLDLIDSRTALIDTWASFDGDGVATGMDCQVWVRTTDDDPAGAPTWSSWERLESAEFENRAFEFQARLFSGDPAYNILVSELGIEKEELV